MTEPEYKTIKVIPVEGRRCYTTEGMLIPEDGVVVVESTYWNRRIKDGDVVVADLPIESSNEKCLKLNKEDTNDDTE